MTDQIREDETRTTDSGETDTYTQTLENAGTYENAGTVVLEEGTTFTTASTIPASGWAVTVTHPLSGRVIHPDVIDPESVQYLPGPNTMPEIRLPVRTDAEWLDSQFDDNPDLDVYLDGEQLPIDELVDIEHRPDRTVLVGEGGVELRQRVQDEYDAAERPTAASDLVTENTSYAVVDNTEAAPSETVDAQDPSGESELAANITLADTDPFVFVNGGQKPAQTCFTVEGRDYDAANATLSTFTTDYSNGEAARLTNSGDYVEYNFTVGYTIPASNFKVAVRQNSDSTNGTPSLSFKLDGTQFDTFPEGVDISGPLWDTGYSGVSGDLTPGTYTLRIEANSSTGWYDIDVVAPYDDRFSYNFDNTVHAANGYLDGPEYHPPSLDGEYDVYSTAFSIISGSASVTMNDITGTQALALSGDFGGTYPISASNATSVSGSFASPGAALNLKVTFSRYSPNGTRDQTPREGYDAQRLDAYDMDATVEFESLLIDQDVDDSLDAALNFVLGEQFSYKFSIENGTETVTIDEPGSTVADDDPEISQQQLDKNLVTYSEVVIKGSHLPVSGEEFQASTSFQSLNQNNIKSGSEAVYDDSGTQFLRGTDYQINRDVGEIKALSGGDLSIGSTYNIDYQHRAVGSHTVDGATGPTLPRTVPGVVSDRQAEQIAFVLAEIYPAVSEPRYGGMIVVPRVDSTFDPLEALNLDDVDLPSEARPLAIRGDPELTPLGLTLNLESAPRLEESLSAISQQVSAVSDRV